MSSTRYYKVVDKDGNRRTLTAHNIDEAIAVWNRFKKRHPKEQKWALVLGTVSQFSLLKE